MQRYANPTVFMQLSARLLPWVAGLAAGLLLIGLHWSLFRAPPDCDKGLSARIIFIHVPSAWLALMAYLLIAASSFGLLVFRHPLADVSAKAAAPIGAVFTLLALVTGSLWGKPTWGVFWNWYDLRLVSMLILLFLYLGLIALRSSLEEETEAAKLTAILSLVGVILLPIIKFSVEWGGGRYSLHQPASVLRVGGPSIESSILAPLLIMALAFTLMFLAMHMKAMRNEILRRRVRALRLRKVAQSARAPAAASAAVVPTECLDPEKYTRQLPYIWSSYLATGALLAALLVWLVRDGQRQQALLDQLEAEGVSRRRAQDATTEQ